ncbi:hypothetical protein ACVINZ_001599 [Mesorhizobium jarvisii]
MATWQPSLDNVEPAEIVGRRLLAKTYKDWPALGPPNGQLKLSAEAFEDSRLSEDLSVDRLGVNNPVRAVVRRLTVVADTEAAKALKQFCGWIAIAAKDLKNSRVFASPLSIEEHGIDNPFHAEIDRSQFRERAQAFHLSVSLRFQFQDRGRYVPPVRGD